MLLALKLKRAEHDKLDKTHARGTTPSVSNIIPVIKLQVFRDMPCVNVYHPYVTLLINEMKWSYKCFGSPCWLKFGHTLGQTFLPWEANRRILQDNSVVVLPRVLFLASDRQHSAVEPGVLVLIETVKRVTHDFRDVVADRAGPCFKVTSLYGLQSKQGKEKWKKHS